MEGRLVGQASRGTTEVSHDILEGARAYASKQAHVNRALAASFEVRWRAEHS